MNKNSVKSHFCVLLFESCFYLRPASIDDFTEWTKQTNMRIFLGICLLCLGLKKEESVPEIDSINPEK